jgi:hypothetical protein
VLCSFLALVLLDELKRRLDAEGYRLKWDDIRRDLGALSEIDVPIRFCPIGRFK